MGKKILDGEIGYDLRLSDLEGLDSFLINSPGGSLFEGLAMYDYVQGNNIEVGVIGVSASAATLPLIASEKRWGTPNSRYLIHNPWTMDIGDADQLEKTAKELKDEQNRALNLYVKHLNGTAEEIQALMNEERIIDADEALQLGLIKEIRRINDDSDKPEGTDINNLFTQFKMKYEMKDEEKKELSGLSEKVDKLFNQIQNYFKPVKMLVLQDVNGVEIDFGDQVETPEQVQVGVSGVTIDGAPAEGDYVMPSGETYVFTSGELSAINEPAPEEDAEMTALREENEQLKQQLEGVQNSLKDVELERDDINQKFNEIKNSFDTVKNDFDKFKNQFSDEKPEENKPEEKPTERKATFNKDKLKNQKG